MELWKSADFCKFCGASVTEPTSREQNHFPLQSGDKESITSIGWFLLVAAEKVSDQNFCICALFSHGIKILGEHNYRIVPQKTDVWSSLFTAQNQNRKLPKKHSILKNQVYEGSFLCICFYYWKFLLDRCFLVQCKWRIVFLCPVRCLWSNITWFVSFLL